MMHRVMSSALTCVTEGQITRGRGMEHLLEWILPGCEQSDSRELLTNCQKLPRLETCWVIVTRPRKCFLGPGRRGCRHARWHAPTGTHPRQHSFEARRAGFSVQRPHGGARGRRRV